MNYKKLVYFSTIVFILFSSCSNDEEGCLDVQATNFDVTADVACNSCCTYPELSFRVNHIYTDSANFILDATYLDAIDSPFTVSSAQMYISDVQLIRADGTGVGVTDNLTLTFSDNTTSVIEDNFLFVRKSIGNYTSGTIGNISTEGKFEKIRFNVGVNPTANHAQISNMPDGHALAEQTESMHLDINDGYIFTKLQIVTDTTSTDFTIYEISGDGSLTTIELDYPLNIDAGFDISLIVNMDYNILFSNIDFQNDDETSITSKLQNNISNAFSVSQ